MFPLTVWLHCPTLPPVPTTTAIMERLTEWLAGVSPVAPVSPS
jgi:hypothetical protein